MTLKPGKLLCIDLQIDPALGLAPDPQAVFGARQLLAASRRLGWSIVHARRRSVGGAGREEAQATRLAGALRPLPTEPVFLRPDRAIAESHGLLSFLEGWRGSTVFIASFDRVATLSCLLACHGYGPRFIMVDDAMAGPAPKDGRAARESFRDVATDLSVGAMALSAIFARETLPAAGGAMSAPGFPRAGSMV